MIFIGGFVERLGTYLLPPALLVACSMIAAAQGFSVENKTPPSIAASGARSFASIGGRFTISLPETASAYQPVSVKSPTGTVTGESYTWAMAEARFQVSYFDLAAPSGGMSRETALDDVREQFLQQMAVME